MPKSKKTGWIEWRSSKARAYLLKDLCPGGILFGKDDITPEVAWDFYQDQEGFENVVWDQFKARLKDHRKQVDQEYLRSQREEAAMVHDRQLFPRSDTNHRGEPVFDLHPAKEVLRKDIEDGNHEHLTPAQFQSTRPIYQPFDAEIFKHRIYQEIRRKKYIHYLQMKQLATKRREDVESPWI
jgi:hypothetical protein